MGELLINVHGSGVSDDITAVRNDVLKGKTAVTSDSDDEIVEGTLELTGNAAPGNVETGKTFYSTNAHTRQTGALRNVTNDTSVKHGTNNTTPVVRGDAAYVSVNTDGIARAEIRFNESRGVIEPNTLIGVPQNAMAAAGGLSQGKLLKGQSAFGITGTATDDATSRAGDILSGKTAYINGSKVTGSMPNQGAASATLTAGNSYTIPAGYHNGRGKVTANSLASQTGGTCAAGDILSGKTAWVNGNKVTGTMTNQGAKNASLNCGNTYTIPAGYHSGSGKVTANSLASQTEATSGAGDILSGKTAWANGTKLTGNMTNRGAVTGSVNCGNTYTIPAGYHNGSGKVTGNSLASQTGVQSGKTAAGAPQVLTGYEAWGNGSRVTGTMANQGAKTAGLNCGDSYTIPAGYHNGSGKITANSLSGQTSGTATAANILNGKTAWVGGTKLTGTIASSSGGTYTPGSSSQTINCGGKYMTGNITINAVPSSYYIRKTTSATATLSHNNPSASITITNAPTEANTYYIIITQGVGNHLLAASNSWKASTNVDGIHSVGIYNTTITASWSGTTITINFTTTSTKVLNVTFGVGAVFGKH